jgi:hypothetical protein
MFERFLWLAGWVPPELAHKLALLALRMPVRRCELVPELEYRWRGLRFRTRVGIAAGLDKNGVALRGIDRAGAGFVELGTILTDTWPGLSERPRLVRLTAAKALWNRLGFPSDGAAAVVRRLAAFPRRARHGMLVAGNIGPHPGRVARASTIDEYVSIASADLRELVRVLHSEADLFVVNLSSPNTRGLRELLQRGDLATALLKPLRDSITDCDRLAEGSRETPLLLKIPPEDCEGHEWTEKSLEGLVGPLISSDACQGFVAYEHLEPACDAACAVEWMRDDGRCVWGAVATTSSKNRSTVERSCRARSTDCGLRRNHRTSRRP